MRNLKRFLIKDYNFQLGFYPSPYWIIPELKIYSAVFSDSYGLFTPKALGDSLVRATILAENMLKKLDIEKKDHPTPLKNLYKSLLPQEELLTIAKVARAVGLGVSATRTLIDHKIIPSIKTSGGRRLVRIIDVLNYKKSLTTHNKDLPLPSSAPTAPKQKPKLLRISEAASLLRISQVTLWRWHKKQKINGFPFGKEIRFLESDILHLSVTNNSNTSRTCSVSSL